MATYSQDSQRLVIVAASAQLANVALATGKVQVILASGVISGATPVPLGTPIKLCYATNKSPNGVIGGTETLNLVSETLASTGMVVEAYAKKYKAPQEQVTTIDVGTAIPNNEYYITVDMDGYGSSSAQNTLQVYATYVSTSTDTNITIAAGLAANLNKNVSRAGVNRVVADASAGDGTFTISGQPQAVIDFNNPWSQVRFRAALNDTFASDATVAYTTAASKGFGYGPEVANIEKFAQGAAANWQWLDYPEMYARDVYTNPAVNYDCVSLRIKSNGGEKFGSLTTQTRQIDIFVVTGADALDPLIVELNSALGLAIPDLA